MVAIRAAVTDRVAGRTPRAREPGCSHPREVKITPWRFGHGGLAMAVWWASRFARIRPALFCDAQDFRAKRYRDRYIPPARHRVPTPCGVPFAPRPWLRRHRDRHREVYRSDRIRPLPSRDVYPFNPVHVPPAPQHCRPGRLPPPPASDRFRRLFLPPQAVPP